MMDVRPLAEKIRPDDFKQFVGQEHLVGKNGFLTNILKNSAKLPSLIFWGPPGSGKTTLARILSKYTKSKYTEFSAVTSGTADIKKVIEQALQLIKIGTTTVLFLDEIHRFNKSQQAIFLPFVENGTITLIASTTENPSFEVISPLLSRCRVLVLKPLSSDDLKKIIARVEKTLGVKLDAKAQGFLCEAVNSDARVLITSLEIASQLINNDKRISLAIIAQALQKSALRFDKAGEEHYNTISAFIKSMRASNPDAALYYLARMVEAGEDPLFIARRMVIFASEDIGMAQPTALVVANEVFKACETIGYPECQINLAHGTVYLAGARKDRKAYEAYFKAVEDVKKYGNLPIPLNILNSPTKLMKKLGYGKGYEMYPDKDKNLLPDKLKNKKYYSS